jgi:hypothetical protein
VEVRGDTALVEVVVVQTQALWLPAPYRQTWIYRETEAGWLRTYFAAAFWPPEQPLHVGRFTFVYGRRDDAAVAAVAAQIEPLDAALRDELGLPTTQEPLTIRMVTAHPPPADPMLLALLSRNGTLYAPSPSLLPLPVQVTEEEALRQLVAGLLTVYSLQEALAQSHVCQWQPLVNALQHWLLWEHSELPSARRYDIERNFQTWQAAHPRPELAWFGPSSAACSTSLLHSKEGAGLADAGASISIVDYAVAVYGHERLPSLIDGMGRTETWEYLIPAVYGVSATEFEAGWQAYLVKEKDGRRKEKL